MNSSDYILVTFDIFDEVGQHASVRQSMTVADIIRAITQEFDDLDRDHPEMYALYTKKGNQLLSRDNTLMQQQILPESELLFGWARASNTPLRQPMPTQPAAFLQEKSSGREFQLVWQPAVIGRPDVDVAQAEMLAVNLDWLSHGRRVSRRHAQILYQHNHYVIESLSPHNPTFVNGEPVESGQTRPLRHEDVITLGASTIELVFKLLPKTKESKK